MDGLKSIIHHSEYSLVCSIDVPHSETHGKCSASEWICLSPLPFWYWPNFTDHQLFTIHFTEPWRCWLFSRTVSQLNGPGNMIDSIIMWLTLNQSISCVVTPKNVNISIWQIMQSEHRIDVFGAFRPFLRISNIFDSVNFQSPNRSIFIQNTRNAIGFAILIFGFSLTMVSDAWYCISLKFDLSIAAVPLGVLINPNQIAITYITIQWKLRLTNELIEKLNGIVNERTFSIHLIISFSMAFWIYRRRR